jgi:prepilin-type N-terminal cleavage/methylation domain-containing protein
MALPNIYKQNNKKGFTLIEIVIVLTIFCLITSFGLVIDLNTFKTNTFSNEESKVVSILAKARSRAMTNYYNSAHGVCYLAPNYIIFRDGVCDGSGTDETILANVNIASSPATIFPTFIFSRLTGNTTGATIHITDGIKNTDIIINDEGTINW